MDIYGKKHQDQLSIEKKSFFRSKMRFHWHKFNNERPGGPFELHKDLETTNFVYCTIEKQFSV